MGHEFVGQVVEADNPTLVGKRVVGEINIVCGECEMCLSGNPRHCDNVKCMGINKWQGCFADYVVLPEENLHIVPDSVSDREAVFTEPLAAGVEVLEQVHIRPGDLVAVIGDGKLGLLTAQVIHAFGHRVVVLGRHSEKLAIAEKLGDEKKSIRNIPPPAMIIADPALTDSLPLSHTIVSLVDAMSQVLEVITHEKASPKIQALGIAGFLNLAEGTEALIGATETEITEHTRDVLSWGSLLMGIAFAHAGLGLAHGLVHFCIKCGLSHGHMVGILLAPGLWVQARQNPETALRLARVQQALTESKHKDAFDISFFEESADPQEAQYNELLTWVEDSVGRLFKRVGLYSSLREAGLSLTDLEWIASQEHALGASFGIPRRRATTDELLDVLTRAFSDR
jgi:hypothetical protein